LPAALLLHRRGSGVRQQCFEPGEPGFERLVCRHALFETRNLVRLRRDRVLLRLVAGQQNDGSR
jgi:hypothetical protein